ncbi:hypothetical protein Hanom_Chr03g00258381 [Helianthus anomalus]
MTTDTVSQSTTCPTTGFRTHYLPHHRLLTPSPHKPPVTHLCHTPPKNPTATNPIATTTNTNAHLYPTPPPSPISAYHHHQISGGEQGERDLRKHLNSGKRARRERDLMTLNRNQQRGFGHQLL